MIAHVLFRSVLCCAWQELFGKHPHWPWPGQPLSDLMVVCYKARWLRGRKFSERCLSTDSDLTEAVVVPSGSLDIYHLRFIDIYLEKHDFRQ